MLRPLVLTSLFLGVFLVSACGGDGPTDGGQQAGPPAAVAVASGSGQPGVAGQALPDPLVVKVTDASGSAVSGAAVQWSVTAGGGSVSPGTSSTDSQGRAQATWTLGTETGENQVTASVSGVPAATFTATARAGLPARIEKAAGDGQEAAAGAAAPAPLQVRVTDAHGNPVPGVDVTWAVAAGGGSMSPATATTDAAGTAAAQWTLGTVAGGNTATASVSVLPPVSFTATGTAGAPAALQLVAGDGQMARVTRALPDSLAVRAVDAHGNPVPGVSVTWAVTAGGGSVSPAIATSGANGVATTAWTMGTAAGPAAASASGAGATVRFSATAQPGPASRLVRVSGSGQSGTVGSSLPAPLVVRVEDDQENPVTGISIAWTVSEGGGAVSPSSSTTDAQGLAQTTWTLGTAAGQNTATASLGTASVPFSATGSAGTAFQLVRVSGMDQSGAAGTALPEPLVVVAADGYGNPVAGRTITWTVAAGRGSVSPATSVTDAAGRAQTVWTLGRFAGANAVNAWLDEATWVSFTAAGETGPPAFISKLKGDGQTGAAGAALPEPLLVQVADQFGNLIDGATVTWAVTQGGGTVQPASSVTRSGAAQTTWTLGSAGTNTLVAKLAGGLETVFTAEAATQTSGIISTNTTWTEADSPYQLTGRVQVAHGATLTIEPGVTVDGDHQTLEVWGSLRAIGTPGSRIAFTDLNVAGRSTYTEFFALRIEHADVDGGSLNRVTGHAQHGSMILRHSVLTGVGTTNPMYIWYPKADSYIEYNVFVNSGGISAGLNEGRRLYIRHNSFYNQARNINTSGAIENWAAYDTSEVVIENNSFWSTDRVAVALVNGQTSARLSAENNFWSTTSEAVIQSMIFDRQDDLAVANQIPYTPFLTSSHPSTPTR